MFVYKIILDKTHFEIDLEIETVSDPITFNTNLLILEESELSDLSLKKKHNFKNNHFFYVDLVPFLVCNRFIF